MVFGGGCLALLAMFFAMVGSAGAVTWTQIPSGTTSEISAIEYQGGNRFWFTTTTGAIYGKNSGTFTLQKAATGVPLNDIEFLPAPSEVGLAVGDAGQVFRTVNGGGTWTTVNKNLVPVSKTSSYPFSQCDAAGVLGDVSSVRFASSKAVYIFAAGNQIARSVQANPTMLGADGTWADANWEDKPPLGVYNAGEACKIPSGYNEGVSDAFFVNENVGYFCEKYFGEIYFTADGLTGQALRKSDAFFCPDETEAHMAGDPANPSRMWAVGARAGSSGLYLTSWTANAWGQHDEFDIGNSSVRGFSTPTDIDYAGGTVLGSGTAGMIINSVDGKTFWYSDAGGTLTTANWSAASLASGNDAAVGGQGGALAISSNASVVPTPPPAPPRPDKTPPQTTITQKPKSKSKKRKVRFEFISSEAGSHFQCKFDRARKFTPCTSPWTRKVKPGQHTFAVRAIDAAGNIDPSPASWDFKVNKKKKPKKSKRHH